MDRVKVVRTDTHSIITGSDRSAIEEMIAKLVSGGARLVDTIKPLGNNWIATCEDAPAAAPVVVSAERIGLRTFIRGSTQDAVEQKVEEMRTYGAAVVLHPTLDGGVWIAVIDDRGNQVKR